MSTPVPRPRECGLGESGESRDEPASCNNDRELLIKSFDEFRQVRVIENPRMYLLQLHLVDHRLDGMRIQFVDKYRIIVMHIRLKRFIHIVAEEEGLVAEKYFYIHKLNKAQGTGYKAQEVLNPEFSYPPNLLIIADKIFLICSPSSINLTFSFSKSAFS